MCYSLFASGFSFTLGLIGSLIHSVKFVEHGLRLNDAFWRMSVVCIQGWETVAYLVIERTQ
ncbi:hypothetical protein KIPB_014161, partial [Kipferlia bialata]|eukprot:g14161.t1